MRQARQGIAVQHAATPAGGAAAPMFSRFLAWLITGLEIVAAFLVALDILLLLIGVIFRYALYIPIVWIDELVSATFLWLTMVGCVLALHRGAHMRLTTIVDRLPHNARMQVETLATMIVCVFIGCVIVPAHEYVADEMFVTTPALGISNSWRVLSIEIGLGAMLLFVLIQLAANSSLRHVVISAGVIALVVIGVFAAQPVLVSVGNYNLIVFFVVLVLGCVLLGVPIGFAFGISTVAYLSIATQAPLTVVISRFDEGVSSVILLSIPLFVVLGLLIEMTTMARAMVDFLGSLVGHVRGGLSYVLLAAMYLVSGISGSKAADMAAIAPVLFPEMKRRGVKPGEMGALLASSAAMSETIPPSLVLITIGSVAGVSIGALFVGGLLPALVLAVALAILARFRAGSVEKSEGRRESWRQIGRTFLIASPALALPFIIRTVVVEGIATATEVATIGIIYTCLAGILVYRCFDWKRIYPILVDTATLSGAILLIVGTATAMGWGLAQSGFSKQLVGAMIAVPGGQFGFLFISIIAFVVLGSLLEGIPAIVLFAPLLFPAARALGIHDVHYAMVVVLAMGIGLFAPPFGVGFYGACAIGEISPAETFRRIWPYHAALFIGLLVVAAFPWLSIGFL